ACFCFVRHATRGVTGYRPFARLPTPDSLSLRPFPFDLWPARCRMRLKESPIETVGDTGLAQGKGTGRTRGLETMLRFTKRADYGLMAIHYIATHDGRGAVSAKRIAEEFGIPPELLAKILQRLAKRKLIVSHHGPKGGDAQTRHAGEIRDGEGVRAR